MTENCDDEDDNNDNDDVISGSALLDQLCRQPDSPMA